MVKKIVIGVVVLAALGIGAVFFYAKVIEGDQPEALSLGDSTTTTAKGSSAGPPTSVGIDGAWSATSDSIVGYRVVEDFVGGITNSEAVGRTNEVTGTLTIAGTTVTGSEFEAGMASVKSDNSRRDNQFQGRIMDVANHPTATFTFDGPIDLDSVPTEGETVTTPATGTLTLRGKSNEVGFDVNAKLEGGRISVQGAIPVTFADYDIPNPSNPVVSTRDNGTLEFLLVFSKST